MLTHCQSQTFVETESPTEGWIPLKLRGLEKLKLWQRFDYPEDYHGDVMVWHVRIAPDLRRTFLQLGLPTEELKYGMTRGDLGQAWHHEARAKIRLRKLAEGELRKDLFLLKKNELPEAFAGVVLIGPDGRTK